jgi:predicted Zn-dependent protease
VQFLASLVSGCYAGSFTIAPPAIAESDPPGLSTPTGTVPAPIQPPSSAEPSATTSFRPPFVPIAPNGRGLYLAPIGAFPADVLSELTDFVEGRYDIDVEVLEPSSLDQSAFDSVRDQFVTEDLIEALGLAYPRAASDQGSVIIGFLTDDVYTRDRPDWNWAFGVRGDTGYAVLSTARMGSLDEPIPPIIKSRLRKMVLRDIGALYYGLSLNYDPLSVLYADVLSVDDLDRMGEEFCGSDCPGIAVVPQLAHAFD